jgi:GNAT superfamily N-acetyltransferase
MPINWSFWSGLLSSDHTHTWAVLCSRLVQFSTLDLARRLERTEGMSCAAFAAARGRLFPDSGATWIEHAGAIAAYDGPDSPITQTFCLGLFETPTAMVMDQIESFFHARGAAADHEVCPLAGMATLDLLCSRGYRPIEVSSVLYRSVEVPPDSSSGAATARPIRADEAELWTEINARGWAQEHPELQRFLREIGVISVARDNVVCFLGELDGEPGAAASLCLENGVALFAGAATIPAMRRRGLQAALLEARMRHAHQHGCDLAMMVAEAGSESQRNAERQGYRIAYTRTKWRLPLDAALLQVDDAAAH